MKSHHYIRNMKHGYAISPLLQSHVLEFGSDQPFGRGIELVRTLLPAAKTGASQSQRLMQHFGDLEEMEQILQTPGFEVSSQTSPAEPAVLYMEADGGFLRTDDGFNETKVGRLFSGDGRKVISSENEVVNKRVALENSDFIAHMGHYEDFVNRLDPLIAAHRKKSPQAHLVAISDGADWIASWLRETHPDATMILDFFHAVEKMAELATMMFTSPGNRSKWIELRKEELAAGKVDKVILAIRTKASGRRATIVEKANNVIAYYTKNKYRMKYDEYRSAGYCIGSGAIESAISTVVQQRCKLVGQRWTKRVAAVLNVRAAFKSGKRAEVRKLISQQMGYEDAA
jgi:hypothetical protein